jgi:F-type H+-transporting ATPase subunit gamma
MNFRQVGKKISAIGNVKKITKAMQMVSAVKMKKAQALALEGNPYRQVLQEMISRVIENTQSRYVETIDKKDGKTLYIFISTNKALCGSCNFNLIKLAASSIDFNKSSFITVGRKGATMVSKLGGTITADFSENLPFIDNTSDIFSLVSQGFLAGEYSKIAIVYNKFISTLHIEPTIDQLLPISKQELTSMKTQERDYVIEPDASVIIDSLLNDYIKEKIIGAILNSEASEHSSRMIAMKNATDNAQEIMFNLTLLKNKLRQSSITNELLDITTAQSTTEEN